MSIEVIALPVGPIQANCYLIRNSDTNEGLIVDPGDEGRRIVKEIDSRGITAQAIWLTHAHFDHVCGCEQVKSSLNLSVSIHQKESKWLEDGTLNGATLFGLPFTPSRADHLWNGEEKLHALGYEWEIKHAPGHSPGSCCLLCSSEKIVIGGDVLFKGSVGRTDLPGGSWDILAGTLRKLVTDWTEDDWRVYPGHGAPTTIGEEKKSNPFVLEALNS